tara:strand:+ start:756 stop:983 length:228 start_codon:yes stop_codon:yes gene_type:complete
MLDGDFKVDILSRKLIKHSPGKIVTIPFHLDFIALPLSVLTRRSLSEIYIYIYIYFSLSSPLLLFLSFLLIDRSR